MLHAASPLLPFWHRPKDAADADGPRFQLRGLPTTELVDVTARSIEYEDADGNQKLKYGSASMRTAIGAGLLGWENFTTADGQPVPFPADVGQRINLLGPVLAPEIFWEILGASSLTGEQRKN